MTANEAGTQPVRAPVAGDCTSMCGCRIRLDLRRDFWTPCPRHSDLPVELVAGFVRAMRRRAESCISRLAEGKTGWPVGRG